MRDVNVGHRQVIDQVDIWRGFLGLLTNKVGLDDMPVSPGSADLAC
jgi:hypothetical protein